MPELVAQFDQCPNCGGIRRYAETLAEELKQKGFARPDFMYFLQIHQGVVMDKAKEKSVPFGSVLPVLVAFTDACMDCGTVYAVRLERGEVRKSLNLGSIPPPDRGMSRN